MAEGTKVGGTGRDERGVIRGKGMEASDESRRRWKLAEEERATRTLAAREVTEREGSCVGKCSVLRWNMRSLGMDAHGPLLQREIAQVSARRESGMGS